MYTWKINRQIIEDLVVLSFLEYKFVCCVFFFLQKKKKKTYGGFLLSPFSV